MSRWRAALPRLEKRNGLTPPSVNIQPSCPACDIFHDQNDTYPDLSVHLRRETYVGKRIAKGDGTCGQDRCLGSHGDGRKRSRLEATLRVCACGLKTSVALSEDECCATSTTAGENAWSRVSGCVTLQENIPLPIF